MGVPAFYRWISEKYPKIVVDMLEKRATVVDGTVIPLNLNEANPNGIEYDNLYIDMNGLIHPCSHPEDREAPKTEEEMYDNVTKYVDRLLSAVRPRRLVFMAIDGVAPRAKMNQQRSRRFRAAQEADEKKTMLSEVVGEMVDMGYDAPEEKEGGSWDSNVITPGTDFMVNLSAYLRYYILDRMNRDPYWRTIKVVLSDANEPGEGEHKIMNFIRSQRTQPGFDPNQRHILHGLDADLIMLALATHEAHFTILREKVTFGRQDRDKPEKSDAQRMLDAQSAVSGACISTVRPQDEWVYMKPLQALHVNTLREYLDFEFGSSLGAPGVLQFGYDIERVIDDFIFLCFFVGNDFLPHLPCLDIRDGALDFLIEVYKELLPGLGEYVTSPGGKLNLRQVDVILGKVGEIEDQIFIKKRAAEDVQERRREQQGQFRGGRGGGRHGEHHHQQHPAPGTEVVALRRSDETRISEAVPRTHSRFQQQATAVAHHVAVGGGGGSISVEDNMSAASKLKGLLGKRHAEAVSAVATVQSEGHDPVKHLKTEAGAKESMAVQVAAVAGLDILGDMDTVSSNTESAPSPSCGMSDDGGSCPTEGGTADETEDDTPSAAGSFEDADDMLIDSVLTKSARSGPAPVLSEAELSQKKEELKRRLKDKEQALFDKYRVTITDDIKLHEAGWKDRYYGQKYKKENLEEGGGLARMCFTYVQGLAWVLRYYYEGVPSWNWYYPFHYAPFASDLVNIDAYQGIGEFELSQPFRPVEQLLAVLPANSVHALPPECQWLMLDHKTPSPIIDLYNSDIPIDPNGKHLPWLWILLLPFVDERRVHAAFQLCQPKMSLFERRKNALGGSVIYMHVDHCPLASVALAVIPNAPGKETDVDVLQALQDSSRKLLPPEDVDAGADAAIDEDDMDSSTSSDVVVTAPSAASGESSFAFDAQQGNGMAGLLSRPHPLYFARLDTAVPMPAHAASKARIGLAEEVRVNRVVCYGYQLPPHGPHLSQLLAGVEHQQSVLTQFDLIPRRPPRLNKVGFNVVDLYRGLKRGDQRGGQQQHPNYHPHNGGNYHQDYQLTGQFQERNFHQSRNQHHQQQQPYDQNYRHQQFSSNGGGGGGGGFGREMGNPRYSSDGGARGGNHDNGGGGRGGYDGGNRSYDHDRDQQQYGGRGDGGRGGGQYDNYSQRGGGGGDRYNDNRSNGYQQQQQQQYQQPYNSVPLQQFQQGGSGYPQQRGNAAYGQGYGGEGGLPAFNQQLQQQQWGGGAPLQQLAPSVVPPPQRHSFLTKAAPIQQQQPPLFRPPPQQPPQQQTRFAPSGAGGHHLSQFIGMGGAPQLQQPGQGQGPPTMASMRNQLMQTLQQNQQNQNQQWR